MKNTRKPYAMGGTTDALSVAPTANYTGGAMIQDMSEAWPGGRNKASRKANKYKKKIFILRAKNFISQTVNKLN